MKDIFQKCVEYTEPAMAKAAGIYPYFREIQGTFGNQVICDGRRKIMIGSNNYLGLAQDERVIEAAQAATRKYGLGNTGSRFLSGTIDLHSQLEDALARFVKKESAVLFSTGFFANVGPLQTLLDEDDYILCDRENHASIIDGCRISKAKTVPYIHNSMESLRKRLMRIPKEAGKLIIVDGVFSMSGDIADLPGILPLAREFNARVYVDEAHSLGVLGPRGEGVVQHFEAGDQVDLIMGTFSKSLGCMGGFLAGPAPVIEYLKHKARCFIFTASLAPSIVGGVLKALEILQEETWRMESLWKNTRKMHAGFRELGFKIGTTKTPVVPILIGSEQKAFLFSQKLYEAGIFTTPAIYPAVRFGEAIVRTSYMATHTDEELNYVLEMFEKIGSELKIFEDPVYTDDEGESLKRRGVSGYDFNLSEKVAEKSEAEEVGV